MTSPCRRNPCAATASCLNNPFLIAVLSMLIDVAGQNGSITSLLISDLPGRFLTASLTELPFCRTVYARLIKNIRICANLHYQGWHCRSDSDGHHLSKRYSASIMSRGPVSAAGQYLRKMS